jgi:hypothetical protein
MPLNDEVRKAVDIDYTAGELDRTAPERIWLQSDTSGMNSERDDPWPGDDGVSWCSESIGGLEVQYIRADLLRAELTRLTEVADSVDPIVTRPHDVTAKLEAANALLREIHRSCVLTCDLWTRTAAHLLENGHD